jgi:XRE family aerobic/anaerobic benzoate catabolism transcriptional regulator
MSETPVRYETRNVTLFAAIGSRVRKLREQRGYTRERLSLVTKVSHRYLAQLEAGKANISVERLASLATALDVSLSVLVDPRPAPMQAALSKSADVLALRHSIDDALDGRDAGELREIKRWLDARFAKRTAPIIALLGLRGAGKSTIGRRLATRLGLSFVELDHEIERAAGLTLAEIFELHGETYYRRLERETLAALLSDARGLVLATGGSLVNDRETYKLLRRRAVTVWLKARPEDHWNRVIQQGDQRPMARNPHAMAELRALLTAREKLYAEAEHALDTSKLSIDESVETLAAELGGWAR